MTVPEFLEQLETGRKDILSNIHLVIMKGDPTVEAKIGSMMGKEMIIYNAHGLFKYALASVKNYMSLHMMPIYGSPQLYNKYVALLPAASFQKGCINFKSSEEMPMDVIRQLVSDAAKIDLSAIRQAQLAERKARPRK